MSALGQIEMSAWGAGLRTADALRAQALGASMYQRATVTMSMRELARLKCIQALIDGDAARRAAERANVHACFTV
jgi:hypothetical protein